MAQRDSEDPAAERLRMIRETAVQFAEREIRPRVPEIDESERFPAEIYDKMAALGMFGITIPEAQGGVGADTLAYAHVMEALARGYAAVADHYGLVELVATLLAKHGTSEQQARYLRPLLAARLRCAYAITEPEGGSDVAGIKTTAVETAEGWRLSGAKMWIHNAPVADFAVVLARTEPDLGKRGMSIFLVDSNLSGFRRGRKEHKMGQRGSAVGALYFDEVPLPRAALLGPRNRGFQLMMSVLDKGRVGIAALAVGILKAALDAAILYAKSRRQFGRSIAEFQAVQWMLADMAKDAHAARLMTLNAAALLDRGERASSEAAMAKCFASDAAVRHTANAVQIHGGLGYIRGIEVERLYRDAKVTQIYEGTNQIQRLIIARHLLA
jgi:alkylation response protein AidB-like acyl-CoA dehydrogenase